jgi:hypothetical protein
MSEGEWFVLCVALAEENRELRRVLVALIFAVTARRELLGFARVEIANRWGES